METIKAGGQEITFYTKFGGLSCQGHEFDAKPAEFVTCAGCAAGFCQANDRPADSAYWRHECHGGQNDGGHAGVLFIA